MTRIITCIAAMLLFIQGSAQEPVMWIFGKDAGLNFNSNPPTPVTYPINNYYSPSSSQCDTSGNLLFYCDGRDIKDRFGNIMTGSLNPVWPAPVHIARKIISNIVPVTNDNNRYFVFMLSPSSGEAPFGTYYNGALTYSIVDMSLNDGKGGIDPAFNNILLNTELDMELIVVPAKNCGYWLITYKRSAIDGQFTAYLITGNGVAGPVYSKPIVASFPYIYHHLKLTYAYQHHKLLAAIGTAIIATFDFDDETGIVSNGNQLFDLSDFRSTGGGATFPSYCLSPNEKYLYLLGYPYKTIEEGPYIQLQQIPIDLSATVWGIHTKP